MACLTHDFEKRVFVVEDEPSLLTFWGRLLSDMGIKNYQLFSNPAEALRALKELSASLLICDVILPRMNGYELAKRARKINGDIPIILTTAYTTDLSRFDLAGMDFHLLHKPYTDIAELKKLVCHILKGEDGFEDMSEDSFSENEDYPAVTEWKI